MFDNVFYIVAILSRAAAMEVCFLASGERAALLDAAEFEGKTAKAVKQALAAEIGVSRFRQRLFLEGDAVEIPDDEVLPQCLQRFSWWSWNFAHQMWQKTKRLWLQRGATIQLVLKNC
jgi:phage tail protein X